MRLLLDTKVLLLALQDYSSLGVDMRLKMKSADVIYVSAASIWEVRSKFAAGELPHDFLESVADSGFSELPVRWEQADKIDRIKLSHVDTFDRVLLVQASQEQLMLVTADDALLKGHPQLCLDARV
jgi:PIN domain nuclease of toxin-antitoxin system